ncbi:glycosyltransferase family 39 protein [Acidobacteria bacterium AH-259-D05]|nr:glycosyltransferase family 39 protein [Acidobacteria bacterium AH-259-D05]
MSYPIILLLAFIWLAAAIGAGRTLLQILRVQPRGLLEPLVLSLSLGFALASYLVFAVGSTGWLSPAMARTTFFVLLIVGLPSWWRLSPAVWHQSFAELSSIVRQWRPRRWAIVGLVGLIAFTAGLNLLAALAPPTEWDSLTYHLAAPAHYLREGTISFVPYRNWANPFTAEMWNILGLLMGFDQLPQVFHWAIGLVGVGALYVLAASRTSRRTALLLVTIYYTSPHVLRLSSSGKSDLAWLAFLILSLHSLLVWRERDGRGWLRLSAIFTGLTLGTKVQGLFWAPGIGLALVLLQLSGWLRFPVATMARTLAYGAIAALVASPWWLRNWLASGDPIWPYGYTLFYSDFWTQELHDKYASYTQGPGDTAWYYVTGLWNLTLNQSAWFFGLRVPITPVLLAFIPGFVAVWRGVPRHTRRFFGLLLIPVSVYYTLWFSTYQQTQYLLPVLALLLILAAYCFWQVIRFPWLRWAATGLLISSFSLFLGYSVVFNLQFAPVVFGQQSRHDFLAGKVSFYDDIEWINKNLPEDSRLLFYHLETFYLQRDFVLSYGNVFPISEESTAEDYLGLLREKEITHIFITGLQLEDPAFAVTTRLMAQLRASGNLELIYANPDGVWIESRTLEQRRLVPVEVLRVVYP